MQPGHMGHLFGGLSIGSLITTAGGFLAKYIWRIVQHDRKLLGDIHSELTTQRTNCLTTIQEQGKTQIDVLQKIHETQIEQVGYIKGWLETRR